MEPTYQISCPFCETEITLTGDTIPKCIVCPNCQASLDLSESRDASTTDQEDWTVSATQEEKHIGINTSENKSPKQNDCPSSSTFGHFDSSIIKTYISYIKCRKIYIVGASFLALILFLAFRPVKFVYLDPINKGDVTSQKIKSSDDKPASPQAKQFLNAKIGLGSDDKPASPQAKQSASSAFPKENPRTYNFGSNQTFYTDIPPGTLRFVEESKSEGKNRHEQYLTTTIQQILTVPEQYEGCRIILAKCQLDQVLEKVDDLLWGVREKFSDPDQYFVLNLKGHNGTRLASYGTLIPIVKKSTVSSLIPLIKGSSTYWPWTYLTGIIQKVPGTKKYVLCVDEILICNTDGSLEGKDFIFTEDGTKDNTYCEVVARACLRQKILGPISGGDSWLR